MKSKPISYRSHTSFVPEWLSFEVSEALGRIDEPHAARKETTVLRLAEARVEGVSWNEMFRKRRVPCNKKTWYGFTEVNGTRRTGWGEEPAVAAALEQATQRARWWVRVKKGQAVESALDVLTDSVEAVAGQLVRIAVQGRASVMCGDQAAFEAASVQDIVKAANSVLDRVSEATAAKGAVGVEHRVGKDVTELLERVYGTDGAGEGGEQAGGE